MHRTKTMPTDPNDPTALELRQLRGRLPRHRSVQGRRAARRGLHRQPSRRPRILRSRVVARRIGLCRRRRPVLPGEHRRMPRLEGDGRRRDADPDRQEPLRRDRPGHDRDGGQRPDHRRRDAARGPGLLGRRRLGVVRRRRPRPGLDRGLEAGLRHLQGVAGAAARRRHWPASSRAAGSTSRPPAPASSARRSGSRSATTSRPATRSSCSPRAASTPTGSAWRASSPRGCRRAT